MGIVDCFFESHVSVSLPLITKLEESVNSSHTGNLCNDKEIFGKFLDGYFGLHVRLYFATCTVGPHMDLFKQESTCYQAKNTIPI